MTLNINDNLQKIDVKINFTKTCKLTNNVIRDKIGLTGCLKKHHSVDGN
jgi:hypothetical protein